MGYINSALKELDLSNVNPILRIPTKFAIASGGKRLRPIMCVYCAEVVGGDYRDVKDAFLALELIHNGTLVHDDIIDEDLFRRGTPSVPVKFGGKRAVLTGDALLSLGLKYAAKTGRTSIVDWLSEAALKMVQGVALQTLYRRQLVSEEEYLYVNYLKSGSLFETAAVLGGLMVKDDETVVKDLASFGKYFGNAYQIRDDICGVYAENRDDELSRNDLLNGDISLPMIYALESDELTEADRLNLLSVYSGERESIDVEYVQGVYDETGALDRSIGRMKGFAEEARKYLLRFGDTEAREFLEQLINQYYRDFSPADRLKVLI